MLAGETAVGAFAARAVQTLDAIIRDAEAIQPEKAAGALRHCADDHDHGHALCAAAVTLADRGNAQAIVAVTRGGSTARRLALHWGVVPVHIDLGDHVDLAGAFIGEQLVAHGLIAPGAAVALMNINPDLTRSDANYLRIQRL